GKVEARQRRRIVEQRCLLGGGERVGPEGERGIRERAPFDARSGRQSRTMYGGKARRGVGDRIDDRIPERRGRASLREDLADRANLGRRRRFFRNQKQARACEAPSK